MAEIIIDDRGIYFNRRIGISRKTVQEALANPERIPSLFEEVKKHDPDLDITVEEFAYFISQQI